MVIICFFLASDVHRFVWDSTCDRECGKACLKPLPHNTKPPTQNTSTERSLTKADLRSYTNSHCIFAVLVPTTGECFLCEEPTKTWLLLGTRSRERFKRKPPQNEWPHDQRMNRLTTKWNAGIGYRPGSPTLLAPPQTRWSSDKLSAMSHATAAFKMRPQEGVIRSGHSTILFGKVCWLQKVCDSGQFLPLASLVLQDNMNSLDHHDWWWESQINRVSFSVLKYPVFAEKFSCFRVHYWLQTFVSQGFLYSALQTSLLICM